MRSMASFSITPATHPDGGFRIVIRNGIVTTAIAPVDQGSIWNGRTLGEVFLLVGKNINIEMIQAGLAEVYRGKPASGLDMEPYWKAENDAKAAKRDVGAGGQICESEGVAKCKPELIRRNLVISSDLSAKHPI